MADIQECSNLGWNSPSFLCSLLSIELLGMCESASIIVKVKYRWAWQHLGLSIYYACFSTLLRSYCKNKRVGSYFAYYCYASTWLNRPHSLLHSLNIFSFSLSAKMLVVNPLWMKAVLDQVWHFYIFVFGVMPSFLTFDTYTWFFCLTASMSICYIGIMPSIHKLIRLLTMI